MALVLKSSALWLKSYNDIAPQTYPPPDRKPILIGLAAEVEGEQVFATLEAGKLPVPNCSPEDISASRMDTQKPCLWRKEEILSHV